MIRYIDKNAKNIKIKLQQKQMSEGKIQEITTHLVNLASKTRHVKSYGVINVTLYNMFKQFFKIEINAGRKLNA